MRRREFVALLGGAAAGLPFAARAQQPRPRTVGFLGGGSTQDQRTAAFVQRLRELGWIEGRTVAIEYRWAEGHYDRLAGLAAELIALKVDVIVTQGGSSPAIAATKATATIPIVFITGGDPLVDGLVTSLARPIGNVTGITWISSNLGPKRLELLRELSPGATSFALLVNPAAVETASDIRSLQDAARASGVELRVVKAGTVAEIEVAVVAAAGDRGGGLVIGVDAYFGSQRDRIAALALSHGLPTIAGYREFAAAGALMSYGPSLTDAFRQGGLYAAKILKGAKPTDLPVLQPTSFELTMNTRTAKALGLSIPPSILARADEVFE